MFETCTEVDPEDVYHPGPPYEVSMEVAVTLVAAMLLCPGHPYAGTWRAALQAGENWRRTAGRTTSTSRSTNGSEP